MVNASRTGSSPVSARLSLGVHARPLASPECSTLKQSSNEHRHAERASACSSTHDSRCRAWLRLFTNYRW